MDNQPDFEDSDPEVWAAFIAELEQAQRPLRAAAVDLLRHDATGCLVPLRDGGEQLYALVASDVVFAEVFGSAEATLLALEQGKIFAARQQSLVAAVRAALAAAGNAAGLRLALPDTAPKLFFIAGDLASVGHLAVGSQDEEPA